MKDFVRIVFYLAFAAVVLPFLAAILGIGGEDFLMTGWIIPFFAFPILLITAALDLFLGLNKDAHQSTLNDTLPAHQKASYDEIGRRVMAAKVVLIFSLLSFFANPLVASFMCVVTGLYMSFKIRQRKKLLTKL